MSKVIDQVRINEFINAAHYRKEVLDDLVKKHGVEVYDEFGRAVEQCKYGITIRTVWMRPGSCIENYMRLGWDGFTATYNTQTRLAHEYVRYKRMKK